MSRRGHGEGSIYQRKDGRWVAVLDSGYKNGKRVRKAVYGRTQKEVSGKLRAAHRKVEEGRALPAERETVGQFVQRWLAGPARHSVRPSTFARYSEIARLHIVPTLGNIRLARLAKEDIEALHSEKLAAKLSPRTVGHIHRVLHRILADTGFGWNVCDTVKPPKVPAKEMQWLSPQEARQLLTAADGDPLEALYVVAVTAGLRQGELLALRWRDVGLDAGRLRVQRTIRRINGGGWVEGEPKSKSSRRTVTLTPLAVDALRRHRARQLEHRLAAAFYDDTDRVFANDLGRPIEPQNLYRRSWWPLLQRARLPRLRFHDLRHSAATLLLSEGVHIRVVQDMLGHSSVTLTLGTYGHLLEGAGQDAADKMQALLARSV